MARVQGTRYIRVLEEGDGTKIVHMLLRTRQGNYSAMLPLLYADNVAEILQAYLEEAAANKHGQRNHGLLSQSDLDLAGIEVKAHKS